MVHRIGSLLAALLLVTGCKTASTGGEFTTPEATLKTLIHAVQTKDADLYRSCFTEEAGRHDRTGLAHLQQDPEKFWRTLGAMLKAPVKIENVGVEGDMAMVEITVPNGSDPDFKAMDMRRSGGEWKIHRW